MNVLSLNQVDVHSFHFLDSKSNVIMDGIYTKLIYTSPHYTLNNIFFPFTVHFRQFEYMENKYLGHFDKANLESLKNLEKVILQSYANFKDSTKAPTYLLSNMLNNGKCKLHAQGKHYVLKISGIWETDAEYGIIYKIIAAKLITTFS